MGEMNEILSLIHIYGHDADDDGANVAARSGNGAVARQVTHRGSRYGIQA